MVNLRGVNLRVCGLSGADVLLTDPSCGPYLVNHSWEGDALKAAVPTPRVFVISPATSGQEANTISTV